MSSRRVPTTVKTWPAFGSTATLVEGTVQLPVSRKVASVETGLGVEVLEVVLLRQRPARAGARPEEVPLQEQAASRSESAKAGVLRGRNIFRRDTTK